MRRNDEYLMYVALVFLFAAVVLTAAEASDGVIVTAAAAALAIGLVAIARSVRAAEVLVVGPAGTEASDLVDEALDRAGYRVSRCVGPSVRACPVEAGRPCPIDRQLAGVAIVRDPDVDLPVPRCEEALHVPTVVVDATAEDIGAFERSLRR